MYTGTVRPRIYSFLVNQMEQWWLHACVDPCAEDQHQQHSMKNNTPEPAFPANSSQYTYHVATSPILARFPLPWLLAYSIYVWGGVLLVVG